MSQQNQESGETTEHRAEGSWLFSSTLSRSVSLSKTLHPENSSAEVWNHKREAKVAHSW